MEMSPGELAGIITAFAALIAAGGWIANVSLSQIQKRKLLAETGKAELDLDAARGGEFNVKTLFSTAGEMIESLRKEVGRVSVRLQETDLRLDIVEKDLEQALIAERKCKFDLSLALERIATLEERENKIGSH